MPPPPICGKADYRLANDRLLTQRPAMPSHHHEAHPPEETQALRTRLRKITGQLNAVEGMLAADYDCPDVLMQLVSARRAIKALSEKIIHSHMEHCIEHATSPVDARRKLRELLNVLERYVD
jgi:DNA-binding FrmR family transcriptional regulator